MYALITAATSGDAYRIKNRLQGVDILMGDYMELPAFMLQSARMLRLPNPNSVAYQHEMLTLCLDQEINVIYALRDEEYALLNEAAQLFDEYGVQIARFER